MTIRKNENIKYYKYVCNETNVNRILTKNDILIRSYNFKNPNPKDNEILINFNDNSNDNSTPQYLNDSKPVMSCHVMSGDVHSFSVF